MPNRCQYARGARGGASLRIASTLAYLLALPLAAAQQPPPPQPVGAALQLSDVSCRVPEPQVLQEFALAVQRHVAAQARPEDFPEDALREMLQGTVYVRLSYAVSEERPKADVERSSGHSVLDDYAVALTRRAYMLPPDSLRCRSFDIAFPLRFSVSTVPPATGR